MKSFITFALLVLAHTSFAAEKKLPEGPPKEPPRAKANAVLDKLNKACVQALSRKAGLSSSVKLAKGVTPKSACACITVAFRQGFKQGQTLTAVEIVEAAYRGLDANLEDPQSQELYIYHAANLEENCKLDPKYRLNKPEPRLNEK